MTGYERLVAALAEAGCPVHGGAARCPAHQDKQASLSVHEGRGGRGLVTCHAGCATPDVLGALHLTSADIGPDTPSEAPTPTSTPAEYVYHDAQGAPLARKRRGARPDGSRWTSWQRRDAGQWVKGLDGLDPGLYRLPEVLAAVAAGETVWVVEGESDADAAKGHGVVATTGPHGAGRGKWRPAYTEHLAGAEVNLAQDRDEVGRAHGAEVARQLDAAGCTVVVVEAAQGKDLRDHLAAGLRLDDVVVVEAPAELRSRAPDAPQEATAAARAVQARNVRERAEEAPPAVEEADPPGATPCPRLDPALVEGHLLGRAALAVAAATGISLAGPWAVLCSIVGTYLGPGPHIVTAGTRRSHDFVGLVGASGQGKGYAVTSVVDLVRPVLNMGEWLDERTATGVNSGEHLIDRLAEEGDCRLLHYEPEIGRLFAVDSRGGSTLSAVVRDAYDSPAVLKTGARSKVARAENPHLGSIVAGTPSDLAELLAPKDLRNGVAGRYGWHHVQQDEYRPFGAAEGDAYGGLRSELAQVIADARRLALLRWTPEARELWATEARAMVAEAAACADPLDALLARGPSECASLVCLLVATDIATPAPRHLIEARHVRMAADLWRLWRVPSTVHIFGPAGLVETTRDAVREREADSPSMTPFARRAERVVEAARKAGGVLDVTGQWAALGNRTSTVELADIRQYLERQGTGYAAPGANPRQHGRNVVLHLGPRPALGPP